MASNPRVRPDPLQTQMDLLVNSLTKEHREMLELFQEIQIAVANGKYGSVPRHATLLGDRLHEHMSVENIKLYSQLKRELDDGQPDKRQLVHSLQREMHGIGRAAIEFIRKMENVPINDANASRFSGDLQSVGAILVRRIRQEEDVLYPLFIASVR